MLIFLAMIFDYNNDWNHKNKEQTPKGRWEDAGKDIFVR